MDCCKLELPMVLLDPWHIPQMVWIKLRILVKVHIPYHLIYSFGNSHSWICQYIFLSHNCDISEISVHKASCFQDDLWLDGYHFTVGFINSFGSAISQLDGLSPGLLLHNMPVTWSKVLWLYHSGCLVAVYWRSLSSSCLSLILSITKGLSSAMSVGRFR